MVQLKKSAAAAALLLSSVQASPVAPRDTEVTFKNLLGWDKNLVHALTDADSIPEITYLSESDYGFDQGATKVDGFSPSEEDLSKRFINGADDRYQYTDHNYPFVATGKLQWSNGGFCSGALIGPRHVLTAKHCLMNDGSSGTFTPAFDNGAPFGVGQVTHAFASSYEWGSPCGFKGDWAVLIIDQRLGDNVGYFGVKLPESSKQDQPIFDHIGYPGDRDNGNRPYRTPGNSIQSFRPWDCDATGPYYTDTDCMGGQSGGPHWENASDGAYIWGTLAVTFDGGNGVAWSGWGSGNEMLDAVIRYRSEFP
jgi:V8-like Glu-specific endopeptidase